MQNAWKHKSFVLVTDVWWKYGRFKAWNRSALSVKSEHIEKPYKMKYITLHSWALFDFLQDNNKLWTTGRDQQWMSDGDHSKVKTG
jgi:hypothetical protein